MAGTTTVHALRYPGLGDGPNVPTDIQHLAEDVDAKLSTAMSVASAAARTALTPHVGQLIWRTDRSWAEVCTVASPAAWRVIGVAAVTNFADLATYITSPFSGQRAFVTSTLTEYAYNGSAWIAVGSYGAMTDYSASLTLTAATTNPTKGNSTYAAKYTQIGKLVYYTARIAIGSTFAAGSGSYRLSLPVTAASASASQDLGSVLVTDSGTAALVGTCLLQSTTTLEVWIANITGGALSSTGPGTAWANGDVIQVSIRYEAA